MLGADLGLSDNARFIAPLYPDPDVTGSRVARDLLVIPTSGVSRTEINYGDYSTSVTNHLWGQGYISRDIIYESDRVVQVLFVGEISRVGCVHLPDGTMVAHCLLLSNKCVASFKLPVDLFARDDSLALNYCISNNEKCLSKDRKPLPPITLKKGDMRISLALDDIRLTMPKTVEKDSDFKIRMNSNTRNSTFNFILKVYRGLRLDDVTAGSGWTVTSKKLWSKRNGRKRNGRKYRKFVRKSNGGATTTKRNSRKNKGRARRWRGPKTLHLVIVKRKDEPLNMDSDDAILEISLTTRISRPRLQVKLLREGADAKVKLTFKPARSVSAFVVPQNSDILNVATINGRKQKHKITVYAISAKDKITDVTSKCGCRSLNSYVIQVQKNCEYLYLDGTEKESSDSIIIEVTYKNMLIYLRVRVWLPELPLIVKLSQYILNPVEGWLIPGYSHNNRSRNNRSRYELTNNRYSYCSRQLYQQSNIDIYTRFYMQVNGTKTYLSHPKIKLQITKDILGDKRYDLVKVSDENVACIAEAGGHLIVEGIGRGQTTVQLISRSGLVYGTSRPLTVTSDPVQVTSMNVFTIASIEARTTRVEGIPNVVSMKVDFSSELQRVHQEARLSISLLYDDGTSVDVSRLNPRNYRLLVSSLDDNVVTVVQGDGEGGGRTGDAGGAGWRIIAQSEGNGEYLKISVLKPDSTSNIVCAGGIVAVSYAYVDIVFREGATSLAHISPQGALVVGAIAVSAAVNPTVGAGLNDGVKGHRTKKKMMLTDTDVNTSEQPQSDAQGYNYIAVNDEKKPVAASMKHSYIRASKTSRWTTLHIALYATVTVFTLTLLILAGHHAGAAYRRYRQDRHYDSYDGGSDDDGTCSAGGGSLSEAKDWVWIGGDTLRRNDVKVQPNEALMADDKFRHHRSSIHRGQSSVDTRGSNSSTRSSIYKGSECSVRLTTNPFTDMEQFSNGDDTAMFAWKQETVALPWRCDNTVDRRAMRDYIDNLKESDA